MACLSLRLPETLHRQLTAQARHEGVSLNQYLVFLLARCSAPSYSVVAAPETADEQRAAFEKLRSSLNSASREEVREFLKEREPVPPEPEWTPELRERFEQQLATARKSA